MSEGVAEFIKKYGKPYDPKTDDYGVEPFQKSFDNASKSSKIYMMHMYWTKQDPYVVKQFIEHYTKPGDIVLDAFCGTGMTGVAAMMCGRHVILTEISPACIHIARNYTTPIEPYTLESAYYRLREKVEPEIRPFYKIMCHNCKNPDAHIANTILSDVLRCPRCSAEVLYAGDGRWEKMKRGEKFSKILCQNCAYEFTKAKAQFVRVEPIEIRVDCPRCKTKREKKAKPLDKEDWRRYINIEGGERFINKLGNEILEEMKEEVGMDKIPPKDPSYWYPRDVKFPLGYNTRQPLKRGITHPYQMFSRRNLIALSILWHYVNEIEEEKVRDKLRFVFTGIIYYCTLMNREKKGQEKPTPRRGTLYISSFICDLNVLETFNVKMKTVLRNVGALPMAKKSSIYLFLGLAQELKDIPSESLDYAFYDPPYGGNINYSELNIMWEAWLNKRTDIEKEIIENKYQGKNRDSYGRMMLESFKEAHRVLKSGRWLTLVYSYSDPSMYRLIQKVTREAGFLNEGEILHLNSKSKTHIQQESDKAQQRFLVINFKKPKSGERKVIEETEDIEYDVIRVIQDFLAKHPGKTRDYIYDQVIKQLFSTVQIQKFDLDEILKNFFRKVGDEWYAPGTLLTRKREREQQMDWLKKSLPEHPEKEVILQLQDFLKKYRRVPYSELREFYLRKIDIPLERNFDDIIQENFKVEEGKVRLPTPVEQERMQNISIQYQIRVIRRFLDGKLDRIPHTEELSNWVEFCYQNEFYKEGAQIYNLLEEDKVEPDRYKKLKKMAEVCRIKSE